MKTLLLISLITLSTGCTSARVSKKLSAGQIGCPPNEITVLNETVYGGTHNWTAVCRGKRFICNYVSGGSTSCKEEI
jgi:hypothetical protein